MPVTELRDFVGYISRKGRNNPYLAVHDSWHGTISTVAQPAVFQCQQRKANTNPTRLYDAYKRVQTLNSSPENYLALSYCWEEWPDNKLLQDKLEGIARRLSIRYFWVDRWCIDQDSVADKAVEIKRMRDYYTGASGCVVLTGPEAKLFQLVPQHDGAILSAYQQVQCNAEALRSLFDCKWVSRVWTLQEALMSRQLIYSVDDQLIDGDYISELVSYMETFSEVFVNDGGNDPEWVGGYGCYGWNPRLPTTIFSRQFRMTGKPLQPTIIRTIFGGRMQYEELQTIHHGLRMPLEEALTMVAGRVATYKEDYTYGILGITERGHEVDVKPGIDWLTMLGRLQRAGMITERQLASSAPSIHRGMSWLPECGPGYGPFTCLERLAAFVPRPKIVYSEQGAAVMGTIFEWVEPEYQEFAFLSIHGMACRLVRGKIRFPKIPGLIARVGGISSQPFDEGRLSGVHVMLCRDVDNDTKETVAIKVAGDIKGKNVYRQDGYVLELHKWLEGGPSMLKGEEWTVGGTGLSGKCSRCDRQ
ncbi:het domain protein [Fusarium avenaceum]|nr:het domain protein [Fusarium avenaceum]